jgi:oligoendopeptidase F
MSTQQVPLRSEIAVKHTWSIESVFATPALWEAACEAVLAQLPTVAAFAGTLGSSPARLAEWMDFYQQINKAAQQLSMYAFLEYSTDTTNVAAAARTGKAGSIGAEVEAALAFAEPELMAIGFATLKRWVAETAALADYGAYFDDLERQAAHVRSAEVEEVLGLVQDAFRTATNTHGILTNSELAFVAAQAADGEQRFEVTHGTVGALFSSPDRSVRESAWKHYADAHLAYRKTQANVLLAGVKQTVFQSRVRRYGSALEAALDPANLPVSVFHNLIATFRKNLPTWHRYWRLRRQALKVPTLHECDIKAPLSSAQVPVPFQEAVDMIVNGMAPLGAEYVDILRRGCLDERWVDIYPNKGKRLGAFSYGGPGTHPFIFMSYNDDLFSMSTLAHELGHSLHSYYSWQTQPLVYGRYTLFAAEVASNFNQAMVRDHLLKHRQDRAFRIGVIEEAMSNFHRYFFIMPTLARLELTIHEAVEQGEGFTADTLDNTLADYFAEGYGDDLVMDRARSGNTWAQFSTHLYSNFYVYQYATGIAGAHALSKRILDGEPGAVEQYLAFLKAGGRYYPLDALRAAGVDLSSPEPVQAAFDVMAGYVSQLEELVLG